MGKLFNSIEQIHIEGDVGQLSGLVRDIDRCMQNIANGTELLMEYLSRYSTTNAGKQFEKMLGAATTLENEMRSSAEDINQMQKDICEYENKIRRFEGMPENSEKPNKYLVTEKRITADINRTVINLEEMKFLLEMLEAYRDTVEKHRKDLCEKKDAMSSIWKDPQYQNFSLFIDDVSNTITNAEAEFDNYTGTLRFDIERLKAN